MAAKQFGVVYDGPVLGDGSMPVSDLAPALLALGDLFVGASLAAFPEQEPVALNIKATKDGSFLVQLAIHSPDTWDQIIHFFSSDPIAALLNVRDLVIGGTGGLFWLIRRLHGRRIAKEDPLDPGNVRLTLDDGTTIEVPTEALKLYRNVHIRRKAREVVEPVTKDGIESVEFVVENEITVSIEEADVEAFDVPEIEDVPLGDHEVEMVVEISSVAFVEKNKWRLSTGENSFAAALEDADFLRRVNGGEAFRKGDMLRCRMRIEQSRHGESLHTEHRVVEVLEHIPREVQMRLGDGPHAEDEVA